MKPIKAQYSFLVLLLGLLFTLNGCGGEGKAKKTIQEGKDLLSKGNTIDARNKFTGVIESLEPENPEAHFGYILTEASDLLGYFGCGMTGAVETKSLFLAMTNPVGPISKEEGQAFNNYVRTEIEDVRAYLSNMQASLDLIKKHPNFSFRMDNFGLRVFPECQEVKLSLKFDQADIYLLSAVVEAATAVFSLMNSIDLNANYWGSQFCPCGPETENPEGITKSIPLLLNLGATLLNDPDYPNFLELDKEKGAERWQWTGQLLDQALNDFLKSVELAEKETGDQSNDFWIVEEKYGEKTLCFNCVNREPFLNGQTIIDLKLPFTKEYQDALEHLKDNLEGKITRVSWEKDVIPILVWGAKFYFALGGSGKIAEAFIPEILLSLIPGIFEFDFGYFFSHPVSPRGLLPVWRYDLDSEHNNFLLEWECPGDLDEFGFPKGPYGFFCSNTTQLIDSPHFSDDIFKTRGIETIYPDGISSTLPYVPFPDPTFNGILFINLYPFGIEGWTYGDKFIPADNWSINATIAKILALIDIMNSIIY